MTDMELADSLASSTSTRGAETLPAAGPLFCRSWARRPVAGDAYVGARPTRGRPNGMTISAGARALQRSAPRRTWVAVDEGTPQNGSREPPHARRDRRRGGVAEEADIRERPGPGRNTSSGGWSCPWSTTRTDRSWHSDRSTRTSDIADWLRRALVCGRCEDAARGWRTQRARNLVVR